MNSFSKAVFLGLAVGLLQPAIADDTLQGGGYKNSSSDFPRHVVGSANPRLPVAAESGHHNDGSQDRSGRDWTKEVIPYDRENPANASSSYPSLRERGWNSK